MSGRAAISVEQPLWRALTGYRVLTLGYALALFALNHGEYAGHGRVWVAYGYLAVLTGWTLSTLRRVSGAGRCTPGFLAGDLAVAVAGIALSPLADPDDVVKPTLPSIWVAGAVLAFAVKAGWRWAAAAAAAVGAANLLAGGPDRTTVHNVLLVCVAAIGIGYVVELARAGEEAMARALEIEAATRERERLARDIHDGVLQVLTMVQHRAGALGGEAAELGRLAGEQEAALRALLLSGPDVPRRRAPAETAGSAGAGAAGGPGGSAGPRDSAGSGGPGSSGAEAPGRAAAGTPARPRHRGTAAAPDRVDLAALLGTHAGERVTFSGPGGAVPVPAADAGELDAAVAAALDNVRRHAAGPDGRPARAWILLEDEPGEVLVTVRDDGPGIPPGRLAAAEAAGRLGASLSIRGRMRELGGEAVWTSVPGQGTEVELRMPKR